MSDARTESMTQAEVDEVMEAYPLQSARRGPLYALSFRNFRLFFIGQLISVAGTWMQQVAQNWLVWDLTHDPRWLGIVSGASALPYVAFAVWGGQAADRFPRRVTLIITQSVAMILAFLLALLAWGRWIPLQAWHIAALAALGGIANAYNMPAQQAFVTDMVDRRDALGNAIALNSFRFNIARFVGPILAGWALVRYGSAMCFFLNGLSYIAVIISLMMMRLPRFVPHPHQLNIWEGFAYIRTTRAVLRVVTLVGGSSLLVWSVSTLFPALSTNFHRGEGGYSAMMAFNGIGAALGAAFLAILGDRLDRRLNIYGGAFAFCLALLLLAMVPNFALLLGMLTVSGFAMIAFGMSANTKVQEEVPDVLRGRVMAVYSLVFQGLMPVGGLEVGFLAKHLSTNHAIEINAALCLVLTLSLYIWSLIDRAKTTKN
ncbi:MAG TPA: MFS transporter [Chthonomonadaceae bacterium]|nr:MFS transporter [Chthonomonadaceae bacterium]